MEQIINDAILEDESYFQQPKESIELEYKTCSFELPDSFWETVSSFANTKGGYIILGVKEHKKDDKFELVGIDVKPEAIVKQIFNENSNKTNINDAIIKNDDVIVYKVKGKSIIQVFVQEVEYSQKPIFLKNYQRNCYIRTDDGDRYTNNRQFKYLIVNSHDEVDGELLNNYDLDDLNKKDINDYKSHIYRNSDVNVNEIDNKEFLKDIGVLKRDRRNSEKEYKLTVGGLLFFGKYNAITQRFPNFQLDYFHYPNSHTNDWDDRVSSGDMNFPSLNIYSFYNLVLPKLLSGVSDKFQQDENYTRGSYYYDLTVAAKEGLVNTLMHPYYDGDKPIKISDKDSFFEFSNPGEMRVSLESFFRGSNSTCRNQVISTLFRRIGISEKAGSGGPRIMKSAKDNSLHIPDVYEDANSTVVKIWKIDKFASLQRLNFNFNSDENKVIKVAVECDSFTTKDVLGQEPEKIDTKYKARKSINSLIKKGVILTIGKAKSTRYILNMTDTQNKIELMRKFKELEDIIMK
ncbi:RNA-binding domain-containing protein [Apilactobacillus xinyiensis]|uniref:RNA-binding domain-containing protein n=1 Tax=Apilactobacillus xinyiensis TaxID=2841032 RepID=UPI00200DFADA|nr:RNA-binding domain-containing protein [Apilactobacillus xinyiensis]MCL0330164.1 putative DNA binding domain-containing protein [Apilactobacillus xinyiensis]